MENHGLFILISPFSLDYQTVTTLDEARRFMIDCFKAVGTPNENAKTVSDNLLEADYRGHYSHGMNRLGKSTVRSKFKSDYKFIRLININFSSHY